MTNAKSVPPARNVRVLGYVGIFLACGVAVQSAPANALSSQVFVGEVYSADEYAFAEIRAVRLNPVGSFEGCGMELKACAAPAGTVIESSSCVSQTVQLDATDLLAPTPKLLKTVPLDPALAALMRVPGRSFFFGYVVYGFSDCGPDIDALSSELVPSFYVLEGTEEILPDLVLERFQELQGLPDSPCGETLIMLQGGPRR